MRSRAAAGPDAERDYPFILNAGSRLPMFIHSRTYRLPWTRALRPLPNQEKPEILKAYLDRSGKLMALLDPYQDGGLRQFLKDCQNILKKNIKII